MHCVWDIPFWREGLWTCATSISCYVLYVCYVHVMYTLVPGVCWRRSSGFTALCWRLAGDGDFVYECRRLWIAALDFMCCLLLTQGAATLSSLTLALSRDICTDVFGRPAVWCLLCLGKHCKSDMLCHHLTKECDLCVWGARWFSLILLSGCLWSGRSIWVSRVWSFFPSPFTPIFFYNFSNC